MCSKQRLRLCMLSGYSVLHHATTALTTLAFTMDSLNAFGKQQRLIGSVSFVQTMCYSVYLNTVFCFDFLCTPIGPNWPL